MNRLLIYGTLGCHLCEKALAVVYRTPETKDFDVVQIDIAESDELITRLGLLIPVVQVAHRSDDLKWPFDETELAKYLTE